VLNHDPTAHSFICSILGYLLYQNKLLKQHVVTLEQKLGLLTTRIDGQDRDIGDVVRKLKQIESVMDGYENRYYEWECSESYYSQDGDANCNS
jgi:hypothetical protein